MIGEGRLEVCIFITLLDYKFIFYFRDVYVVFWV